jgi:hypothetical protein
MALIWWSINRTKLDLILQEWVWHLFNNSLILFLDRSNCNLTVFCWTILIHYILVQDLIVFHRTNLKLLNLIDLRFVPTECDFDKLSHLTLV